MDSLPGRIVRWFFVPCLAVVLLAAACSDNSSTVSPVSGGNCVLASDCQSPLVCTAGRCHVQCVESRDCDFGQRCVQMGTSSVCQLQVEAHCTYNSDCASPLVCAVDLQCRNQCQADRDCTKGQVCTPISKVCAEPSEVDSNNELPKVAPASDAGLADASSSATVVDARETGVQDVAFDVPTQDGAFDAPALDAAFDAPAVDAPQPDVSGPVLTFENAWQSAVVAGTDAGANDGGTTMVQVRPTPIPASSPTTDDPPRITSLSGLLVGTVLQITIAYESDSALEWTLVSPVGADYYLRILSAQAKTSSHPVQYTVALAMPQNLGQLVANSLSIQLSIALQDALTHVSAFVPLTIDFRAQDAGVGSSGATVTATATPGKACTWGQPAICLPDGTGILSCALDELSFQVIDCQAGPPAYRCVNGKDGGIGAECVCPNSCGAEGRTCGKDSCGNDCGACPAGAECDAIGNCRLRSKMGCADGTRDGFSDPAIYPSIASCVVWWDGAQNMRTPRSGQEWCGNSTGIKCTVPADGCAPGWHICMQHGYPADIRDRINLVVVADGGTGGLTPDDCALSAGSHWYVAASSSAFPYSQGGTCTAIPLGCYDEDVNGNMDTIACGVATNSRDGYGINCASAIWPGATRGVGSYCASVSISQTDQNGILCCQDPEITGS
jgi:hypothetical protein